MNEKQTVAAVRPTKKQRELLTFIANFITEHGYSPSYREIMSGLGYTSVATVALHVRSLITRGHLRKRGHSARSLELVHPTLDGAATDKGEQGEEKWLVEKVKYQFLQVEQAGGKPDEAAFQGLFALVTALQVLGFDAAAQRFQLRLNQLGKR